jgi:hypothetical protein
VWLHVLLAMEHQHVNRVLLATICQVQCVMHAQLGPLLKRTFQPHAQVYINHLFVSLIHLRLYYTVLSLYQFI